MAWSLKGSYVETCSCDLICPCNATFDHGATYDYCRVMLVFSIKDGESTAPTSPAQRRRDRGHAEGDDRRELEARRLCRRASVGRPDEQARRCLQRPDGRPDGGLAPLVGEMLGVERAPIEVIDDGVLHSVRVGNVIDFEIKDIVPFGVETGQPVRFDGMFHPVASNLTIAEATRSKIDAFGISYEGKTGLSTSEFSWAA